MSIVRTITMFQSDSKQVENVLEGFKLRFTKKSSERDKHGVTHKDLHFTLDLTGMDIVSILEAAAEHIWIRVIRKNLLNTLDSTQLKQWSGHTIKAVDYLEKSTALEQARRENRKLVALLKKQGFTDEQIDAELAEIASELEDEEKAA